MILSVYKTVEKVIYKEQVDSELSEVSDITYKADKRRPEHFILIADFFLKVSPVNPVCDD